MLKDAELVAKFKERMPLGGPEDPEGVAAEWHSWQAKMRA